MNSFALLAVFVAGVVAQEGNLIVHKQVLSDYPDVYSTGMNFTVKMTVYNIGDGSAFDVKVKDTWPSSTSSGTDAFKLVAGSFTSKWAEITSGASVSANYTVLPTFEGRFEGARATGSYKITKDGASKKVLSTAGASMQVISEEQFSKYFAKHYQEWTIFYLGCLASVFVPLFVWGSIQYSYTNGVPNAPVKQD